MVSVCTGHQLPVTAISATAAILLVEQVVPNSQTANWVMIASAINANRKMGITLNSRARIVSITVSVVPITVLMAYVAIPRAMRKIPVMEIILSNMFAMIPITKVPVSNPTLIAPADAVPIWRGSHHLLILSVKRVSAPVRLMIVSLSAAAISCIMPAVWMNMAAIRLLKNAPDTLCVRPMNQNVV